MARAPNQSRLYIFINGCLFLCLSVCWSLIDLETVWPFTIKIGTCMQFFMQKSRILPRGIVWKELMLNMDNDGRIICFLEDATTLQWSDRTDEWVLVEIRINYLVNLVIFFTVDSGLSLHYYYPPAKPFTKQGKVKTWLLISHFHWAFCNCS